MHATLRLGSEDEKVPASVLHIDDEESATPDGGNVAMRSDAEGPYARADADSAATPRREGDPSESRVPYSCIEFD